MASSCTSSSSKPCVVDGCKLSARGICDCCLQNLCRTHWHEHADLVNVQLNPLVDEINTLADDFARPKEQQNFLDIKTKLDVWRQEAVSTINEYYERKCRELDTVMTIEMNEQREEVERKRVYVAELIREKDATREKIDSLTKIMIALDKLEQQTVLVNLEIRPLKIDENSISINKGAVKDAALISFQLGKPYKSLELTKCDSSALGTNGQYILVHKEPNICLLDEDLQIKMQAQWTYNNHGCINHICWSSSVEKFILAAYHGLFSFDTKTRKIEKLLNEYHMTCTCSPDSIYLVDESFNKIIKYLVAALSLSPPPKSVYEYTENEYVESMAYNNSKLALVVVNRQGHTSFGRVDVLSTPSYDRTFSFSLEPANVLNCALKIISFGVRGWLIVYPQTCQLQEITQDGQNRQMATYASDIPWNAVFVGDRTLAISTSSGICLHKLL
ncbi:unnamed protein product [Didymodactylos carnosus]|uniref:B box-type domain-containing protein n=1 Tax=Didymodactylos carnosus TaxID=1234261 RepID=A0A814JFQ7_9BILA|nr:unnamed protein product [Didymodactylos carnosus]CAF1036289.1 unnamed protein product [Didymodactylos carnosus]CAF3777125.1 unnamed protein product [Didymodactylos carnosus]CAF3806892.1 unnamed protein product [Didymodactylos carnosus]